MASFTSVGDDTSIIVQDIGDEVTVAISGTYVMTILFQREKGSPGSGAWETLATYSTEDATEAAKHTTQSYGEKLRLVVTSDTSGTATATLTDSFTKRHVDLDLVDPVGNVRMGFEQGPATLLYDGERHVSGGVVNLTAATLTVTAAKHAGRVITCNKADGITITMPAALGTGDVYTISVITTATSDIVIQAASSADVFNGAVLISSDIAGVTMLAAATTDTITLDGAEQGGLVGSSIRLTDVAVGVFMLGGALTSTGSEATPFSAAV